MGRPAGMFDDFFRDQTYGLRGDYTAREWHIETVEAYVASVMAQEDSLDGGQHRFCIDAGTGAGKTQAAAHIASFMLNRKLADQVILICPNRSIRRKAQKVFRDLFGIDLATFHAKRHADGIPRTKQGYILTYAHLIQDPTLHRRICGADSLVIFDEIHHLGDKNGWGDASLEAFGRVRFVLALTGTPYRSDNTLIPFVAYEETARGGLLRFKAEAPSGFSYPLGRAVADGVCREPLFTFHDAVVQLRPTPESEEFTVTFKDAKVNAAISSLRLRHAVRYGSIGRTEMLKSALDRCREEGRKVIVFLGGDTEGEHTPTTDATEFLPAELRDLGITDDEFEVITGEDADAQDKIEKFGASNKWILVSINMVSEGTDIPELSAAIFLTSVTAKQTTVQRIGRVLRSMGPTDPFPAALIFMYEDPNLVELAGEIKSEIRHEVDLAKNRRASPDPAAGQDPDARRHQAEGYCTDGGRPTFVMFGDRKYPALVVESARKRCREEGLPSTMLQAVINVMMRNYNVAG